MAGLRGLCRELDVLFLDRLPPGVLGEAVDEAVRARAAFILGEIKSDEAVIPLMRALKSGSDESTQIIAALSLCKIGDARGVFAVKQEARFGDSKKVRNSCSWFYDQYVESGVFVFPAVAGTSGTISAR